MATRRRIGVSAATTEAARRQLMQPVPCWEKTWVAPEHSPAGSTLKIYKWIRTEKTQQFSDDEGELDEPLAPLPDEPEVVDGDEDIDQDETAPLETAPPSRPDTSAPQEDIPSKPSSPKPTLTMPLENASQLDGDEQTDDLDLALKPLDSMNGVELDDNEEGGGLKDDMTLDISSLGPDGLGMESEHDLSQLDGDDVLLGTNLLDDNNDPFADTMES